jgi:hypothetical protein
MPHQLVWAGPYHRLAGTRLYVAGEIFAECFPAVAPQQAAEHDDRDSDGENFVA